MFRKIILPTALCLFFALCAITGAFAQQRRVFTGKLLSGLPHPRTNPDNQTIFSLRLRSPYRSYNGANNNLIGSVGAKYGSTDIPLFREMPADYDKSDP